MNKLIDMQFDPHGILPVICIFDKRRMEIDHFFSYYKGWEVVGFSVTEKTVSVRMLDAIAKAREPDRTDRYIHTVRYTLETKNSKVFVANSEEEIQKQISDWLETVKVKATTLIAVK
jgi:non-ribosomal peptide synthetase component E (peptide arylation enzyme)